MAVENRIHPLGEAGVRSSLEEVAKKAAEGGRRDDVRRWAVQMLDEARKKGFSASTPRDRARILLEAVQAKLWVPDPVGTEFIQGAHLTACTNPDGQCFHGGDCFPMGTLLLTDDYLLRPIESVQPGMRIWGLNDWSTIEGSQYKGTLSVDVITLNNGSQLQLTSDHKVYVLRCPKHAECSCPVTDREEHRIPVSELQEGDVLSTTPRIPFGSIQDQPDLSYLDGLFISDGWVDGNNRFGISGQDGQPKERQKREVQAICEERGIHTRWHRKYIAVNDSDLTLRMQQLGHLAPNKHAATLNLGEACAAALLRGVMADSGANTHGPGRTLTTTSRLLAVQMRVLHKMFGIACGWKYIENHGGLGKNPIYRLGTRPTGGWMLRVRNIERDVFEAPCYDIQTSDHRVYLPEHDVTVSNCDDLTVLLAAAFLGVGLDTLIVGHGYGNDRQIAHVLAAVRFDDKWHYADPSPIGGNSTEYAPLGKCVPFTRERLYSLPNEKMICDEDACLVPGKSFNPASFVEKGYFIGVNGTPPQFGYRMQWLPEEPLQWLGQSEEPTVSKSEKRELSTAEKALIVSVVVSVIGLGIKIWEIGKNEHAGTSDSE